MGLTLLTPASVWPVTLEEARAQVRVTATDEDSLLESYIRAATKHVEQSLGISIAEQTWKLTLDEFSDAIELPRGPVQSVDAVAYSDEDGVSQTASAGLYTTDLTSDRQWVVLNSDESWPDTLDAVNAVSVTYTAGFEEVPDDLKHAILLLIGHWFENRATVADKAAGTVPFATEALIQPYRRVMV